MKKIILVTSMLLLSISIYAADNCLGTENMYTCTNYQTGNSYSVNKFGGNTQVTGHNNQTGANWSQNTQTIGNQSYTTGRDKDGNTWRHNTNQIGNTQYYNGNDSQGNNYNGSCNPYTGCYTNGKRQ